MSVISHVLLLLVVIVALFQIAVPSTTVVLAATAFSSASAASSTSLPSSSSSSSYISTYSFATATSESRTASVSLSSRGSSLAASVYQDSLYTYSASTDWSNFITGDLTDALPNSNLSNTWQTTFTASYVSTGSGDGKNALIAGTVDFAGSDSPFTAAQFAAQPDIQMLPTMASAVVVVFNIPELVAADGTQIGQLILDRTTLPLIFAGNITAWNDPRILNIQTGIVANKLSNITAPIRVVVRASGSGTSNIFTHALASFSPVFGQEVPPADAPAWPSRLVGLLKGNLALDVNALVAVTPYTISYSPLGDAVTEKIPYAAIINRAGAISLPTFDSITAALLQRGGTFDSHFNAELNDADSARAYPIIGYSYICLRLAYSRQGTCQSRALLARWLQFYYTSATTSTIANRYGFGIVPSVIAQELLDIVQKQLTCANSPVVTLVSPYVHSHDVTGLPSTLVNLMLTAYSAVEASYLSTSVIASTGATPIINVLTGQAATSILAYQPQMDVFIQSASEITNTTTSNQQHLLLTEHPNIAVLPISMTAITIIHNVVYVPSSTQLANGTIVPVPVPAAAAQPLLVLDLNTLSGIILGEVLKWNDPVIQLLNPTLAQFLPNTTISLILYSGASDLTATWRAALSDSVPAFKARVGYGNDLTGIPFIPSIIRMNVEERLSFIVNVKNNALSMVQLMQTTATRQAALMLYPSAVPVTDSVVAPNPAYFPTTSDITATGSVLNLTQVAMVDCVSSQFLDSADIPTLLTPTSDASNPDNSNQLSSDTYTYNPADWNRLFKYDLRPTVDNWAICWPMTVPLYAMVPLHYTNVITDTPSGSPYDGSSSSTVVPAGGATEPYRLSRTAGSCTAGSATIKFFSWLTSGGLKSSVELTQLQVPLPEKTRKLVREVLEHAECDGVPILIEYHTLFSYSSHIVNTSWILFALAEFYAFLLLAFLVLQRDTTAVRAASFPFCCFIVIGTALMTGVLPLLTISNPTDHQCKAPIWLMSIGFVITFGSLFLKTMRMWRIMEGKKFRVVKITNVRLTSYLVVFAIVMMIVLITWEVDSPLGTVESLDRSLSPPMLHRSCGSRLGFNYLVATLVTMGILLTATIICSVLVRTVPQDFNESKYLCFSTNIAVVVLAILIPGGFLMTLNYDRDNAAVLLIVGIWLNSISVLSFMILTKVGVVFLSLFNSVNAALSGTLSRSKSGGGDDGESRSHGNNSSNPGTLRSKGTGTKGSRQVLGGSTAVPSLAGGGMIGNGANSPVMGTSNVPQFRVDSQLPRSGYSIQPAAAPSPRSMQSMQRGPSPLINSPTGYPREIGSLPPPIPARVGSPSNVELLPLSYSSVTPLSLQPAPSPSVQSSHMAGLDENPNENENENGAAASGAGDESGDNSELPPPPPTNGHQTPGTGLQTPANELNDEEEDREPTTEEILAAMS